VVDRYTVPWFGSAHAHSTPAEVSREGPIWRTGYGEEHGWRFPASNISTPSIQKKSVRGAGFGRKDNSERTR
jgi:hypothetical protein